MRSLAWLMIVALGTSTGGAQGRGGKGRDKDGDSTAVERVSTRAGTEVNFVFSPREITLIRTHYQSRSRNLPPGLQKKVARGGNLPPGWQKKMEPLPRSLEIDLVVLPGGYRRGVMDGHAVIYDPLTHAILDIISLF